MDKGRGPSRQNPRGVAWKVALEVLRWLVYGSVGSTLYVVIVDRL